jgi:signal transduction histidine kinase
VDALRTVAAVFRTSPAFDVAEGAKLDGAGVGLLAVATVIGQRRGELFQKSVAGQGSELPLQNVVFPKGNLLINLPIKYYS